MAIRSRCHLVPCSNFLVPIIQGRHSPDGPGSRPYSHHTHLHRCDIFITGRLCSFICLGSATVMPLLEAEGRFFRKVGYVFTTGRANLLS